MSSKALGCLIRLAVIVVAACTLFVALVILHSWDVALVGSNPGASGHYLPLLFFVSMAAVLSRCIAKAAELQEVSEGTV